MNSLFVTSSAYRILNGSDAPPKRSAVEFLSSLFNQTVKVYTSTTEVSCASENILEERGFPKMYQFLKTVFDEDGGVNLLPETEDLVPEALKLLGNLQKGIRGKENQPTLRSTLVVCLMKRYGIKNVFTFDQSYQNFNVIVWPK